VEAPEAGDAPVNAISPVHPVRCGVLLPTFGPLAGGEPPRVVAAAQLAAELGFDSAWVGDQLACAAPGLDAPSCLAAAAAVTEGIALGMSALLLGPRQPAWTAKQLTTIDVLSGGRLLLGVGVGREVADEFIASPASIEQRGARLDDALAVICDLLTGQPVDQEGRIAGVRAPALAPSMTAPPPIYVGGHAQSALHRAALYGDVWLPMWLTPGRIAERSERLAELAIDAGRRVPGTALMMGVNIDDDPQRARAEADAHIRRHYRMGLDRVARWTLLDSIDGAVEHLDAFWQAGVQEFVLMPLGRAPMTQYERLAEVRSRLLAGLGRAPAAAEARG
jgi:alkanesulfonate monooxygenase SsuD/methylene tetrahydromethanopterin reductase-like flavin-dependent oxidoreductase (luciferase family)